jgi:tetratricopeptide (TPR) repeat protein
MGMNIVEKSDMKFQLAFLLLFLAFNTFSQNTNEIELANEYYAKAELEKAREMYEQLARNTQNIPYIHQNYFNVLVELGDFSGAESYLDKVIKRYPDNLYYQLDIGTLYVRQGDSEKANTYFRKLISKIKDDNYKVRITAQYFINKQLMDWAVITYNEGRRAMNNDLLFSLEMANIYRMQNQKDKMVGEYLNYVVQNPSNLNYVKNTLQNLLSEPDELESLETLLYERVQSEPGNELYAELLIWVNLQQKNFYGAFIQARALDKRAKSDGRRILDVGLIAMRNEDYEEAIKIFDYIIKEYPGSFNFIVSRMYRIKSREEIVKKFYPVNIDDIKALVNDYDAFVNDIGINTTTLEAMRNQAQLYAFYLDEKEEAIRILNEIIKSSAANQELVAESKLTLGDIYILTGETWESTLLYSQVEKSMKESKSGYEAKLRNARLSYYKGEFDLARDHLNILKTATTREIANDAMDLSLLIVENTGLDADTTNAAMKKFAAIELLLFQNKAESAIQQIDSMLVHFSNHTLADELYMQKAKILMKAGQFDQTITLLEKIVEEYGYDVLGDNAYYTLGKVYEEQLKNKEKAMEIYQDFLVRYPGSIFATDARKRFRKLRGDFSASEKIIN